MGKRSDIDAVFAGDVFSSSWSPAAAVFLSDTCWGRQAGLPVCRAAGDYCQGLMREIGLENVHAESFEFPGYRRGKVLFKIAGEYSRMISAESLLYSPECDISGELVFIEDFEKNRDLNNREQLGGKIILSPDSRHKEAAEAGAAAVIRYNANRRGGLITHGKIMDKEAPDWRGPIPGVSISMEDALYLRRRLEKEKVRMELSVKGSFCRDVGRNIVGDLSGAKNDHRMIILGSHYDGFDNSSSATDNASGVAVSLGAMKALSKVKDKLNRRVRCVLFSGEEIGLLGSMNYVKDHKDELDRIDFMMNTDCSGIRGEKVLRLHAWPEQRQGFVDLLAGMEMEPDESWHSYRSDHLPFWLSGCSTAYGFGGENPGCMFQHTTADTADKLQPDGINMDAFLTAKLLFRLSAADGWELPRRKRSDVESEMDRLGLLEKIRNCSFPILPGELRSFFNKGN